MAGQRLPSCPTTFERYYVTTFQRHNVHRGVVTMRLSRACVFAIRSALASVLAALVYVFVLAVVGPLGAGVALLIDVWAQLRNGH